MNRNWWNRLVSRKPQAAARRRLWLCLEQLEERCQPSVTGFRPIDEVGNNVANPNLGIAGTDLLRLSPDAYKPVANGGDGFTTPSLTYGAPTFVAGPRLVSNTVSNQATVLFGPTDINTVDGNGLSNFGYTWGQFIDHDMDLTPTQSTGAPAANKDGINGFPIPVDPVNAGDPIIGPLPFTRSIFDTNTGTTTPRQQPNVSTSYLDLSQVYGSTTAVASALRSSLGRLKSSPGVDGITGTKDDLLPFNTTAYFTTAELAAIGMGDDVHLPGTVLFAAGDPRANETTELISLQTLFMRNHNRIAGLLHTLHPGWNDEQLYQEARKINIAQEQFITYTQYLPALLGPGAMPFYTGYKANVDPSISTEFSTVAFRFGHSLLNNTVPRHANNGTSVGDVSLAQSFFNPALLTPGATDVYGHTSTDIGAILKGDADNVSQAMDVMAVSAIRNLLFFGVAGPGDDLIARDIWRADDHGIGTYNQVLIAFGLAPISDTLIDEIDPTDGVHFVSHGFEQITSDLHVARLLSDAFTGPTRATFLANGKFAGDINPFIAGLAEDHVPGSDMGPLFTKILVDQFRRLRDGDRYFFLNESWNLEELLLGAQGATLGQIIKVNTNITNLQFDVFKKPSLVPFTDSQPTFNFVPPTLKISGLTRVNEGTAYKLTLSGKAATGHTIQNWTINWGDGTTDTLTGNPTSASHVFASGPNSNIISASAADDIGNAAMSNNVIASVLHVAPKLTLSGAATVAEGMPYTLNLTAVENGGHAISSWTITWGDGTVQTVSGDSSSVTHVYSKGPRRFAITAKATDDVGTYASTRQMAMVTHSPGIVISGATTVVEGTLYTLDLAANEVSGHAVKRWTITWGDGKSQVVTDATTSVTHTFVAKPTNFTISAKATDDVGTYSSNAIVLSVTHVTPTLNIIGAPTGVKGQDYTLNLSAVEPVIGHAIKQWTINWGDGTTSVVKGNPTAVKHKYTSANSFTISAMATDDVGVYDAGSILDVMIS